MKNKDFDVLVKKYKQGSSDVFDEIYENTKKIIYLSIYPIVKKQNIIEDLMQDTYIKIINSINRYESGTSFLAWCTTIAKNEALNYYNKAKRENTQDLSDLEAPTNNYLLDEVLMLLEGIEKEIFIYRFIFEYKLKDLAIIFNMPKSTIYYIYKNTLKKVKKIGEI